jgi:hypothetical protein
MADDTEFNGFGKPVSMERRSAGYAACKEMGLDSEASWECVGYVAEAIERDDPYRAIGKSMKFIDLTGAYRLMAVMLTDQKPMAEPLSDPDHRWRFTDPDFLSGFAA